MTGLGLYKETPVILWSEPPGKGAIFHFAPFEMLAQVAWIYNFGFRAPHER